VPKSDSNLAVLSQLRENHSKFAEKLNKDKSNQSRNVGKKNASASKLSKQITVTTFDDVSDRKISRDIRNVQREDFGKLRAQNLSNFETERLSSASHLRRGDETNDRKADEGLPLITEIGLSIRES
jgi:hypothetical protein